MRPIFSQCAILQCDTTRIGQDAPCGAMPKLIHPSIPGPWHAPSLASWKTWQVLGRQGGTWPGRLHLAQQGRVQTGLVESGQVESSRVLADSTGQPEAYFFFSHRCTHCMRCVPAEFFPHLKTDRPSPSDAPGDHRPSQRFSRPHRRPEEPKHPGTRHVIGSCPSVDMGCEI